MRCCSLRCVASLHDFDSTELMNFLPEDTIVISPHQVSCRVGEDVVVLGLAESAYFGLKGIGPFLWELIQNPITVREICERVMRDYDVSAEQAELDIHGFLSELLEAKLIEVRSGNAG